MTSQTAKTGVNVGGVHAGATRSAQGWVNGFLGMLIFSGSLPATRVAVLELDPVFLTAMRAMIAVMAGVVICVFGARRFSR